MHQESSNCVVTNDLVMLLRPHSTGAAEAKTRVIEVVLTSMKEAIVSEGAPNMAKGQKILEGILLANSRIFNESKSERKFRAMCASIVCVFKDKGTVSVMSHGQTQIFLCRDTQSRRLSERSVFNKRLDVDNSDTEDPECWVRRDIVVEAVGLQSEIKIQQPTMLIRGDLLLICNECGGHCHRDMQNVTPRQQQSGTAPTLIVRSLRESEDGKLSKTCMVLEVG